MDFVRGLLGAVPRTSCPDLKISFLQPPPLCSPPPLPSLAGQGGGITSSSFLSGWSAGLRPSVPVTSDGKGKGCFPIQQHGSMGWSPGPPPPIPGFVSAVPGGQRERGPSAVSPGPEQGWPEGFVLQGCVPPPPVL